MIQFPLDQNRGQPVLCHFVFITLAFLSHSGAAEGQYRLGAAPTADEHAALELFDELIGYPTVKGRGKVAEMARSLERKFLEAGFAREDVSYIPHQRIDGEKVAALVVRYRSLTNNKGRPILFLAHMDVVDASKEDWGRDPFTLVEEDGYFIARGAMDDKLGVALLTHTFIRLKSEGYSPGRDLVIAFTGDEETGMETTRLLVTKYRELIDAEFALNLDAGGGRLDSSGSPEVFLIQTAEKTYATFEIIATNAGGHSSLPRPDNAIFDLMEAIENIRKLSFRARFNEMTRSYFRHTAEKAEEPLASGMRKFSVNPDDPKAQALLRSDPVSASILGTTCIPTMLEAGHAENALPQTAKAKVNCRIFPGVSIEDTLELLTSAVANKEINISVLGQPKSSPASPIHDSLFAAIRKEVEHDKPGTPVVPYMAPYATDGLQTRAAGIPTYGVLGLFIRNEDVAAHGLNERVPVKEFYVSLGFWYRLIKAIGTNIEHQP